MCRRVAPRTCQALTVPGDIAIVTATSLQGPRSAAAQSLDVAALRSALGGDTIALASAPAARDRFRVGKGLPDRLMPPRRQAVEVDDRHVVGGLVPARARLGRSRRRAAVGGLRREQGWSMRMPLFRCQAPA